MSAYYYDADDVPTELIAERARSRVHKRCADCGCSIPGGQHATNCPGWEGGRHDEPEDDERTIL